MRRKKDTRELSGNEVITKVLDVVYCALGIYGFWLLTSPDPEKVAHERWLCVRRLARWLLIFSISLSLVRPLVTVWFPDAGWILMKASALTWPVRIFFLLWHARSLVIRIPHYPLAIISAFLAIVLLLLSLLASLLSYWSLANNAAIDIAAITSIVLLVQLEHSHSTCSV